MIAEPTTAPRFRFSWPHGGWVLACLLCLCGLLPAAWAEQAVGPAASAAVSAGANLDSGYILGPGDEISVDDVNMGRVTESQIKILADGTVDLPLVGQVSVVGMTVDEAQAMLNEAYGRFYVNPAIALQVLYQHPLRFYVKGAVANPGVYVSGKRFDGNDNNQLELGTANLQQVFYKVFLTDALVMAGGMKYNADIHRVTIHRTFPRAEELTVDLWELLRNGSVDQDVTLHDQDVVEVAELPREQVVLNPDWESFAKSNLSRNLFRVNVIGAVKQPGSYQIKNQGNVFTAIAEAGGMTDLADADAVYILRTNSTGQVFKRRIDLSKGAITDPQWAGRTAALLLPNDVVFVDESRGRKLLKAGKGVFDRASGAVLLPFFNRVVDF